MKDGFVKDLLLEGRYKTISPLNHGSFGMVFLARDQKLNELVAIKCLAKPSVASPCPDANQTDHLLELLCHDRLGRHPNIVNLLHAFESTTHMFLVLEYCPMGDLYEAIRLGRGPLQTDHVRSFMRQLIDAVQSMHAKGLYHRDIKPENIFLAADGSVKLGDFGLSTTEARTSEAAVGSDRYMAPEQYDPGEAGYEPAQVDVWAIGICLLNILFSRNPFVTPSEADPLFADFARDRQSLFDVFPALSQDAYEVLTHALAIDPSKRSLSAMRQALDRVLAFTTDEDISDDDFCTGSPTRAVPTLTTASRAPLRTPSIQSPPVEQGGAFPWARALNLTSPVSTVAPRQLSAIPDTESVQADNHAVASSFQSGIDSALGASIQSLQLREPKPRSLAAPTAAAQPVPVPTPTKPASASLYATDNVSKSWSDLWDEEAESEAEEHDATRRPYQNLNWSSDALADEMDHDITVRPTQAPLAETTTNSTVTRAVSPGAKPSPIALRAAASISDVSSLGTASPRSPAYSPPAKRGVLDKWAALGHRRRAIQAQTAEAAARNAETAAKIEDPSTPSPTIASKASTYFGGSTWRRGFGLKAFSGNMTLKRGADSGDTNGNGKDGKELFGGLGALTGSGSRRISNRSLTNLPATPGSVGLGLQEEARSGSGRTPVRAARKGDAARVRDWRRAETGTLRLEGSPKRKAGPPVAAVRDEAEWVGAGTPPQL